MGLVLGHKAPVYYKGLIARFGARIFRENLCIDLVVKDIFEHEGERGLVTVSAIDIIHKKSYKEAMDVGVSEIVK